MLTGILLICGTAGMSLVAAAAVIDPILSRIDRDTWEKPRRHLATPEA